MKFVEENDIFNSENLLFTCGDDGIIKLHNLKKEQVLANFHENLNEITYSPILSIYVSEDAS